MPSASHGEGQLPVKGWLCMLEKPRNLVRALSWQWCVEDEPRQADTSVLLLRLPDDERDKEAAV